MSRTFTLRPDLAGANSDDRSINTPLICWRGSARADQISSDHSAQPGDTRRTRNPTPRQRSRQTDHERHPLRHLQHCFVFLS